MKTGRSLLSEELRAEAFRLLSQCYYLPEPDLMQSILSLERCMTVVCPEAVPHVSTMKEDVQGAHDPERLKTDYARLFVGPFQLLAPPYGSVYLDSERRVMGDSTLEVSKFYREAGVNVALDFRDPPDHIAAELEFLYFLILKEVEAIRHSHFEQALDFIQREKEFLSLHIGAWVFEFADHVEKNAETPFYRSLARVTKVFIRKHLSKTNGKFRRRPYDPKSVAVGHGNGKAGHLVQQ